MAKSSPTSSDIHLVYEDEDFIAVNKPSGLLCVPGLREPDNLFDRVLQEYPNARVVHRLDMSTSGLVLFALHIEAQRALSKLFEKRMITKSYIAEVFGTIAANQGEIHAPLICDWPNRPKQKVDWLIGKKSTTLFKVLERASGKTRVELSPMTGRSHQLRVHMLTIGHPILGDELYFKENSTDMSVRLHLHAQKLRFTHPFNQKTISLHSPCDF